MSARSSSRRRPLMIIFAIIAAVLLVSVGSVLIRRLTVDAGGRPPAVRPTASATAGVAPPSTAPSSIELDPADRLPEREDIRFDGATWTEGDTYVSAGPELPDAECISTGQLASLLGNGVIARRDFTGSSSDARFTAWLLEYPTVPEAEQVSRQLTSQTADCLAEHDKSTGPHELRTEAGTAQYSEALTSVRKGRGTWNSVGVLGSDTQVLVVNLTFRATENHFVHQAGGPEDLPPHPMRQTLPRAAARLG